MEIKIDLNKVRIENGEMFVELDSNAIQNAGKVELGTLAVGDRFMIGDDCFIVLEHANEGTKVISENFVYSDMSFGDNSDWRESRIRTKLNTDYFDKLSGIINKSNIVPIHRDLTSLDGLDYYGTCVDNVSMLTAAEYAKYHKTLGLKSSYPDWWWTITPASTPSNDYSRYVCCVGSSGVLRWLGCVCAGGVRPFCILKSSLLVLANKE